MTGSTTDGEDHVKDIDIAAYLDRGLGPDQLERVEEHLSSCSYCRENVIKTQELVAAAHRPRRFYHGIAIIAAAAAVAIFAVPTLRPLLNRDARNVLRDDGAKAGIVAYGPIGEVTGPGLRFTWGASAGALSYRLSLTNSAGVAIWTSSGTDTTASLPDSVPIIRGATYTWTVDAVIDDGTTRSTGLHEFGIAQ